MGLDLSDLPRFSLAERDRRWQRVRALMVEAACDCIVAPGMRDLEEQTTSRYLSQIGGVGYSAWVVFPADGEPTAVVDSERNREFAARAQNWITDVRAGNEVELIPERIRELGLESGRIGLTQFRGHYREALGNIPHDVVVKIHEGLPAATIYGENDVLALARMTKGPEEVAVIEQVAAANEAAIGVMCETARPGLRQEEVWYAMCDVLVRASRGWPARLSVTFGGSANSTLGMPIPDRIPSGALCSQEICARIQGYRAQCNHTFQVGDGGAADYADAMRGHH
jgi:Xaa-Pro dipeptidase